MLEGVVQARLVAGDAGVDPLRGPGLRLERPVGIGQERAGHADQIGLALGEDLLGGLGHVDPVGGGHRDGHDLLDPASEVHERRPRHGGDDGGHASLMPADAGVEQVHACGLQRPGQVQGLLQGLTVRHQVHHGHAEGDQEVRPGRGADAADDLGGQPSAPCGGAAPGIGTVVRARGEELIDQIALRAHDLYAVVPGLPGESGRPHEVLHGLLHPAGGQRPRSERGDGRLPARGRGDQRVVSVPAGVQQLQGDPPTGLVHGLGDHPVLAGIACRAHGPRGRIQQTGQIRGEPAGDDQPHSPACTLGVERAQLGVVLPPVLQAHVHRAHDQTVRQLHTAQSDGCEQVRVCGGGHAAMLLTGNRRVCLPPLRAVGRNRAHHLS